ncbi:MAG: catechol 1,2-dioxygenase [Nocardioides sp.]
MGEIVGAGLLAHVPTIMLPEETRRELNKGEDFSLGGALLDLRRDVFETLDYDTVVVLDSHWFTTVEFVVTAQDRRAGLFTAEELPRGMCRIPYDWRGDPRAGLRRWTGSTASQLPPGSLPSTMPTSRCTTPSLNLWKFLGRGPGQAVDLGLGLPKPATVTTSCASGRVLGDAIAEDRPQGAGDRLRRAVAHLLEAAPTARPRGRAISPHIRTQEARAADEERIEWFKAGDHKRVLDTMRRLHALPPRSACSRTT